MVKSVVCVCVCVLHWIFFCFFVVGQLEWEMAVRLATAAFRKGIVIIPLLFYRQTLLVLGIFVGQTFCSEIPKVSTSEGHTINTTTAI